MYPQAAAAAAAAAQMYAAQGYPGYLGYPAYNPMQAAYYPSLSAYGYPGMQAAATPQLRPALMMPVSHNFRSSSYKKADDTKMATGSKKLIMEGSFFGP